VAAIRVEKHIHERFAETADPSAALGMTKRREQLLVEVFRLPANWAAEPTDRPATKEGSGPLPLPPATALSLQLTSPFCHPERSRGICGFSEAFVEMFFWRSQSPSEIAGRLGL
jgi:hypothetical protein